MILDVGAAQIVGADVVDLVKYPYICSLISIVHVSVNINIK